MRWLPLIIPFFGMQLLLSQPNLSPADTWYALSTGPVVRRPRTMAAGHYSFAGCDDFGKKKIKNRCAHNVGYFFGEIVIDVLRLHRYLFSVTTAKVVAALTPWYIITHRFDENIQSRFYDPDCHNNAHQFPQSCHKVARYGVGVPMVALSSLALFARDDDLRTTAYVFALGLPFVHWGKDVLKNIETKACLRPWHEDFSCQKRSPGGFPSGHMANIAYATALFGMRHGLKFGIPLGLFATFVFADFVNGNRHYVSQIVAGAGLGIIYALAANKVVDYKLSEKWAICGTCDAQGKPGIKVCCAF